MPPPLPIEEPEDEEWLLTYADAITLLMAFFVMLVSFSKIDLPTFEDVMAGIKDEIGTGMTVSTTTQMTQELESAVFKMQAENVVDVQKTDRGITIEMSAGAFFIPGTATIRKEALPIIESMAVTFAKEKFKYFSIAIEGHTDDDPINTPQFPSNWELSAGRSAAVAKYFIEIGLHPYRQTVTGFSDTRPKFPNRDMAGVAIPENQSRNRRVELLLESMMRREKDEFSDLLLKERLREEEQKRKDAEEAKMQEVQDKIKDADADTDSEEPSPSPSPGPPPESAQ
ncbi:MAG: OmpA family protein [Rhodospirillaceae bacterium]|nr:OmpA family protein [Rhodospirillaceae bacterium]